MIDIPAIQKKLLSSSNLDWFDNVCDLLKKENYLTVSVLEKIIGDEDKRYTIENRGSKFLTPFDKRFKTFAINPDINTTEIDAKIEYFSIGGTDFNLMIKDIRKRFDKFMIESNIYDGGTQLFFYPIPEYYEFSAISFYIREEKESIKNVEDLVVHSVSFHFLRNPVKLRDGYSMVN
jgi:hypothetical protein